ncbi:MAG TPA: hypothetical protein VFK79_04395 [Xanthobacteraceae bacterium]|nr:hypothetical protein [Xanthobacteraceae bacterium]
MLVNGSPTRAKVVASSLDQSFRQSQIFGNIPEAAVIFTQGGTRPTCVLVQFSAQTFQLGGDSVMIRATLDNITAAIPAEVQYSTAPNNAVISGAYSYQFVFPNVAPGNHILRMQFRSAGGGGVFVHRHTTVVHYQ